MAIEAVLPTPDMSMRHSVVVQATADRAYTAIRELDITRSWLAMLLFRIRALPALLAGRPSPTPRGLRLDDVLRSGFVLLDEVPGREIVIGTVGRFWRASGTRVPVTAASFASFSEDGTAKAAMSFRVDPIGPDRTRVTTETRVVCADARARRLFSIYWLAIGIGSSLIRREMLRLIKERAEA